MTPSVRPSVGREENQNESSDGGDGSDRMTFRVAVVEENPSTTYAYACWTLLERMNTYTFLLHSSADPLFDIRRVALS